MTFIWWVGGGVGRIFGGKSTFSKLFWTCLGSVWALFLTLKGPLSVNFQLKRSIIDLENRDFQSKFDPLLTD